MNTYDLSDPYGVEESQIANRRRLAEMLMQQGMTGPAYSGKAAVAKALTQLFAGSQIKDAEKEQRGLAERKEQGRKAEMDTLFEFINQKPAQGPGMPQMDDEGNPLPGNMDQTAAKRMELARTMLGSRNPQLQQFALQSMMPKAGKLERVDLGDRIGLMDEAGNVVKEIPKGVGPDTRYSRETVGADTKFTHSTPSATAVLGDERTRAEGAANRGVTVRGQNMADERAKDATTVAAENRAVATGAKSREDLDGIRKEFNALPEVKAYKEVVPVLASAKKAGDTPQGDLALVYAVGKVLDPNSVVREGEMTLVLKSGSLMERMIGTGRKTFGVGGGLTPDMRAKLVGMLEQRVDEYKGQYDNARRSYEGIAKERGYDPAQIFGQQPGAAKRGPTAGTVVDGFRFKGGDPNDRSSWEPA